MKQKEGFDNYYNYERIATEDEVLTVNWFLAEKVGNNYVTYHNGTSFMVEHGVPTELSFGEFLRPSTTSFKQSA